MTENDASVFWQLVGKRIAGEISQEEDLKLNDLLEKHPELLYTLETIGYYWNAQNESAEQKDRQIALAKHMQRMRSLDILSEHKVIAQPAIPFVNKRSQWYRTVAVAAGIVGITLLSIPYFRDRPDTKAGTTKSAVTKTIVALNGSKNHFVLPDGTTVWLNAGTTIKYQSTFGSDSIREIFLTGEAFFKITHDDKHPFIIHTTQMDIRDLGTSFNVKSYPSEKITEATLVEGVIQVKLKNGTTSTTLSRPHEKITVRSNQINDSALSRSEPDESIKNYEKTQSLKVVTTISTVKEDSLLEETAWLNGVMVFRNEAFKDLATRMERWYNVTISFEKPEHKRYRFSGTFHDETVEEALKELQAIKSFSFSKNNDKVIISN